MNGSTRSEQGDDIGKYSRFSKHDLYQDFSKQGLIEFPSSQEAVSSNLQFLYLQGNALQKLPNDFFHKFLALRHLDLRHNHLVEIPISVAGHECLEVLLLQDNKLTALPCALGQVPRLRKLQISGNPLEWPPGDTLSKGLESILSFLRCAFMEQLNIENDNAIPKADNFDCTKDTDMRAMVNAPIVKIVGTTSEHSDSFKALDGSERNTQVKQNLSEADKTILLKGKSKKLQYRSSSTSSNSVLKAISPSFKPHISPGNALAIMNGQCFPLGYKKRTCPSTNKVYKMLLKKIWLNELKCILQSQDHALQKQKTSEALDRWRQVAKLHQKSNCSQNWTGLDFPYDLDTNYLEMVSRAGLQMLQNKSLEKKRYSKPTSHSNNSAITYQEQFNQILRSFHELTDVRCRNIEPTDGDSSKQREILAEEMQRIHKLQKAIKALHLST